MKQVVAKYTYKDMPKSTAFVDGMKMIEGDIENRRMVLEGDIVYANKDGADLHLKILRPQSSDNEMDRTRYPVLIHVQGSAYLKQNMDDHIGDFKEIVEAGYVVAIVEYRDSSMVRMPGQIYDVKDAVGYIADHADELCVDASHLYLSGDSSGGHAAAMCWATWPVKGLVYDKDTMLPPVKAFMDFYGCTNFKTIMDYPSSIYHGGALSAEGLALGGAPESKEMLDRIRECNVDTYIDKKICNAPLLILHGNKDRFVPFEQSVELFKSAKEAGKDVEFYCINNSDHGGSVFYSKEVYKVILDFLGC